MNGGTRRGEALRHVMVLALCGSVAGCLASSGGDGEPPGETSDDTSDDPPGDTSDDSSDDPTDTADPTTCEGDALQDAAPLSADLDLLRERFNANVDLLRGMTALSPT